MGAARIIGTVVPIGASLGCGEVGGAATSPSTTTTVSTNALQLGGSTPMATQIGSEGFWDCRIEEIRTIDPAEPIPALGGAPIDLVAALTGVFVLDILDLDAVDPVPGTLDLVAGADWGWADVVDEAGCVDHVVASVGSVLDRDGVAVELEGVVAVRPDAAWLLLAGTDLAAVAPAWGDPTLAGAKTFRLEGDLDPASLVAEASYATCDPDDPLCDTVELLADVGGIR